MEAQSARDRANKSGIEKQKTIKTPKDSIKDLEQNCKENHGQFFIEKARINLELEILMLQKNAKKKI